CNSAPDSPHVWIECANMYAEKGEEGREKARGLLEQALTHIPNHVDLWMTAAGMETTIFGRCAVYKRGLEKVPESVLMWRELIQLEQDQNSAVRLLRAAVKCVPSELNFWTTLAKLQPRFK
ncbi:pre-mRNA-processing factor 6/Prp1/STA1, partial [Kipferlia bialata]